MSLSASLANYDIQKLSQEMEKLGGGINIKREPNLVKFVFDPRATQSYTKKDQKSLKELESSLKKEIFSCYVMCLTLLDEDKRYFSNLMVVDCDLAQYYKDQTKEYTQRFMNDLKLILKEASALKLINIDTLNERLKKKSKLSQFFYSGVLKNAKNVVISSFSSDSALDTELGDILATFLGFEVICYRSKNISNSFLSTGPNIFHDFMKEYKKRRKENSRSPLKVNITDTLEKQENKKRKTEYKEQKEKMDFTEQDLEELGLKRLQDSIGFRKALPVDKTKKSPLLKDQPMSVEMLEQQEEEEEDYKEVRIKNMPAKTMKYDLKTTFEQKENTGPETLTFKKNLIQYKRVLKESDEARKEILKENERLEAEIINLRTNYEKEIESYRHNLLEMNTKLHNLLDQEKDDRFKVIVEAYESDITKLELQVKNLRDQIDVLNQINSQQDSNTGLDLEGVGKLKEMVKILNLELINKDNIISKYRYQEREKENKTFFNEKTQEENRLLMQENKKLKNENAQIIQQLRDLTDMYDNLKKKNVEIYNEMQEQYMTLLHVTEENNILRDLAKTKKIETPSNINSDEPFQRSPKLQKNSLGKPGEKKGDAFASVIKELKENIEMNIKIETKRPIHLIDRLECLYNELNTRYEEAMPKQQKYLDFLGDLQVKMEEYLGKSDELVKKSNKEIRKFLTEVLG